MINETDNEYLVITRYLKIGMQKKAPKSKQDSIIH